MTREEFDRDRAQSYINGGVLYPWSVLAWWEKILRVVVVWPMMVITPIIGAVLFVAVLGAIAEGVGVSRVEKERCQRQAVTPYEYHQCR